MWATAIDFAVQAWLELTHQDCVFWRPGFTFAEDSEGRHVGAPGNNGLHVVMINPIDSKGKHRYSIRDRSDSTKMLLIACHEITHFSHSYHDESFASLNIQIVHHVVSRLAEVVKQLNVVVKTVN